MPRLTFSLVFAVLISVSTISYSQTNVIENFENGLTGTGTNNWDDDGHPNWGIATGPLDANNNVLFASRASPTSLDFTAYMNFEFTFAPAGLNFSRISFDFYADEGARSDTFDIEVGIGSFFDTTPDTGSDYAALLGIKFDIANGYHLVVTQPSGTPQRVINFSWIPERWHNVTFELETTTQTFEIIVDNNRLFYDSDDNGSLDSSTFDFINYSLDLFSFGVVTSNLVNSDEFLFIDNITASNTSTILLGDVNLDGAVDFSDIPPFIAVLSAGEFQVEADCDENRIVNFADIPAFIAILINQ